MPALRRFNLLKILLSIVCLLSLLVSVAAAACFAVQKMRADVWRYWYSSPGAFPQFPEVHYWQFQIASGDIAFGELDGPTAVLYTSHLPPMHKLDHVSADPGWLSYQTRAFYTPILQPDFEISFGNIFSVNRSHLSYSGRIVIRNEGFKIRLWLLALLSAFPPLLWEISHRRQARKFVLARSGYCRTCGYDMRHSPHRCPECGTIPPRSWSLLDRLLHAPVTRLRR